MVHDICKEIAFRVSIQVHCWTDPGQMMEANKVKS